MRAAPIIRNAVKQRMEMLGVTVADLARETGYTKQHIYDLLSGDRRWNETTIEKVCHVLGLEFRLEPTGTDS